MTSGPQNAALRDRAAMKMAAVQDHAPEAAAFLKALANDQRLVVMCSLLDRPLSVGEINERIALSQSALSQHLSVLRAAGLVSTRRESQTIYYALTEGPALKVMEILYETFCAPSANPRAMRGARRKAARAG